MNSISESITNMRDALIERFDITGALRCEHQLMWYEDAGTLSRTRHFVCSCDDPMLNGWRVSFATDPETTRNYSSASESRMLEFAKREHAKHIAAYEAAFAHVVGAVNCE